MKNHIYHPQNNLSHPLILLRDRLLGQGHTQPHKSIWLNLMVSVTQVLSVNNTLIGQERQHTSVNAMIFQWDVELILHNINSIRYYIIRIWNIFIYVHSRLIYKQHCKLKTSRLFWNSDSRCLTVAYFSSQNLYSRCLFFRFLIVVANFSIKNIHCLF